MMEDNKFRVLISAYACGPNWGSEVGMGWNWMRALSEHCHLTVITEEGFRAEILDVAEDVFSDSNRPEMHFIDIGEKAREYFWSQGDWRFYYYYKKWQLEAFNLAQDLVREDHYDLVHQLNMIGYREPGYLYNLSLPFVWGPIGGYAQMPWRFLSSLGFSGFLRHCARNVINSIQARCHRRVRASMSRADALVAATDTDARAIQRLYGRNVRVINETGCSSVGACSSQNIHSKFRIIWCGKLLSLKALPLALYALQNARSSISSLVFHIVGDGPDLLRCQKLAQRLRIDDLCVWHGRLPHDEAVKLISDCDCMLFTSLKEGTPAVILESISSGTPVVCHDACGFGAAIDCSCGIKIPLSSPRESIVGFANAIRRLASDDQLLLSLSDGCQRRAQQLLWSQKSQSMLEIYRLAIKNHVRQSLNS